MTTLLYQRLEQAVNYPREHTPAIWRKTVQSIDTIAVIGFAGLGGSMLMVEHNDKFYQHPILGLALPALFITMGAIDDYIKKLYE